MYSAPAGTRPTGADRIHPTDAVLPNGRIAAPVGTSVFVGSNPLGLTLSTDGRYAILSNGGIASGWSLTTPPDTPITSVASLTVVDARSMRVVSVYHAPATSFFMGVASARDPNDSAQTIVLASDGAAGKVRIFNLDAFGRLTETAAVSLSPDPAHRTFPAQIAVAPDGRTAFVADNLGNSIVSLDLTTRTVQRTIPVGDFPLYVAVGKNNVVVSGTGLAAYTSVEPPTRRPQFAAPPFDPSKSSALTVFGLSGAPSNDSAIVRMDEAPDGSRIVGGAAPGATIVSRDGSLAYVAMSNVDRVAVVALAGTPRVVRGLDLRLYPGAPYGAQPSAEALSRDGKRLFVALAGLNAVAVLDARKPTRYRYGLIPTGWYPTALALSANGRYLFIAGGKGVDGWGLLQRVDLKHTSLIKSTLAALRYNRTPSVAQFNPVIPPLQSNRRSTVIDHVVCIAVGTQGYDAVLGDLKDSAGAPHGNGDASLVRYPESVTPNLHALARSYALADNFYAPDPDLEVARHYATAGETTLYEELVAAAGAARAPMDDHGADPEDYGREGYLFNAFARAGLSYRDYGGLLRLSGYDGTHYHLDVPALAALNGNVDLDYASWNPKITNAMRATEFVRDMQRYVSDDRMPNYTFVWLPGAEGTEGAADADKALGEIVDYLSRTPHWSSTAIFVVPEGLQGAVDHVNAMRSYALIVSPLARAGYVGDEHLSVGSVVKTEEEIFGLPALTLNDLLASDMARFFADSPNPQPYQAQ
jgi:YVTN family beta-propeller protein